MTPLPLSILAAAATAAGGGPAHLDPLRLFLDADIVVKAVMLGLLAASLWTWTIIVGFWLRLGRLNTRTAVYEKDFWEAEDFDAFAKAKRNADLPPGRVARAGVAEWRHSTRGPVTDREGVRQRLGAVMESQVAQEADELSDRLNFLATVGSVAPFVGLFGTVWGIMNSFFQIGQQESSSLAVVAPGISEALFATAIGLFAAIPAVIAYNRFSHAVNRYESRLHRFADRLHASFSRQLEAG